METENARKAVISGIGERIKKLRKKNKETQQALGELLNKDKNKKKQQALGEELEQEGDGQKISYQSYISKIERGQISLTIEKLMIIAEHYNVSLDYLCTGKDDVDVLSFLNEYVRLKYGQISDVTSNGLRSKIPVFQISKKYYEYLKANLEIRCSKDIPDHVKNICLEEIKNNFYQKKDTEFFEVVAMIYGDFALKVDIEIRDKLVPIIERGLSEYNFEEQ